MLQLLLFPLIVAVVFFFGRALVHLLGSPMSGTSAMKWGMMLLGVVVLVQAAPGAVTAFLAIPLPSSDALAIALAIGYLALAYYGKRSIDHDFFERPESPERLPPRHRVAPPPPNLSHSPPGRSGLRELEQDDVHQAP